MDQKVKKFSELRKSDFINNVAIAMSKEGLVGVTLNGNKFKAKDIDIPRAVFDDPYLMFQLMDLFANDKSLLLACFDILYLRFYKNKEGKNVKRYIETLNETLSFLGLPIFNMTELEKVKFIGDDEFSQ